MIDYEQAYRIRVVATICSCRHANWHYHEHPGRLAETCNSCLLCRDRECHQAKDAEGNIYVRVDTNLWRSMTEAPLTEAELEF